MFGFRCVVLDPQTFECFYECWKELEMESRELQMSEVNILENGECFLKVSEMVKCSFGTGRIALTQKRYSGTCFVRPLRIVNENGRKRRMALALHWKCFSLQMNRQISCLKPGS